MEEIQNIKNLLQKVSAISKKYEEIAKITGENYNVFNILGLSTKEVRTHSAFIADLLNIEGYHEQGNVFLELFYEQLEENEEIKKRNERLKIPSKNATVYVEENIGAVSGDEGGRIDIVLKDNNNQIVIENKINADDQDKQLVRYNNQYPNALLLYLTLQKKDASNISIEREDGSKLKKNEDYFNITYKEDITKWLKKCKEKATNYPILRETLTQYIYLIKQLTGQTMNDKMGNEIIEILSNEENFNAGVEIANNIENVKVNIINTFWKELKDKISDFANVDDNWEVDYKKLANNKDIDDGLRFTIKENIKNIKMFIWVYKDYNLHFGFEKKYNKDLFEKVIEKIVDKKNTYLDKDEKEIQIPAYKNEIYLDDFENKTTLELFDDKKREAIISEICENIKEVSKLF